MKNNNADSSSTDDEDTDSSQDEPDNAKKFNQRDKRNVSWCGVDTESHFPIARRVVWPPPSTSTSINNSYVDLRHARMGNPLYGAKMQLFSKTGYFLAVYPDGKVRGTKDDNDLHTHLEIVTAGFPGHIKIRGMLTNMYVAIDRRGRLYAEPDPMEEANVFIESFQGSYNVYLSRKYAHLGWHLGIKKNGKFKRGPKTRDNQKAVRFLPRRTIFEG